MPALTVHTAIAKDVVDQIGAPILDNRRGSLYLGATAPDIRVLTRWERERTHFFDLNEFEEQSGVEGLFDSYPELANPSRLNEQTASFVAGYITHLVMDEMWITSIYRPFFGEQSGLGGGVKANVMDRTLQYSMDSDRRSDKELMLHIMNEVAMTDLDLQIDFIDRETLKQWHGFVVKLTEQKPDWDRYRSGTRRHLERTGVEVGEEFEELMKSLPDLVDETISYLTPERLEAYVKDSRTRCVEAVRAYLECE
ncbi:MAG: zinc dependent phospholipase C family protein [Chloroflexi bacterium]|nr:zinc dependent phospholipase C family protein [Chloroflexota bacterium]